MRRLLYTMAAMFWLTASTAAMAETLTLQAIQFPEDRDCDIEMTSVHAVPGELDGEVEYQDGRAKIRLDADDMRPALTLGGDVTSYVLWAIPRQGAAENLGEMTIHDRNERIRFSTGLKEFALVVTAEMHPRVERPSGLVLFHNLPSDSHRAPTNAFTYSQWATPPMSAEHPHSALGADRPEELDILQARRLLEIAEQRASVYAPEKVREARTALGQANNFLTAGKEEQATDFAERSMTFSSDALLIHDLKVAEQAEQARLAAEAQERQRLVHRTERAEERSAELSRELTESVIERRELQLKIDQRESQLTEMARQTANLAAEQAEAQRALKQAESSLLHLDMEKQNAREEATRLKTERDRMAARVGQLATQQTELEKDRLALQAEAEALRGENARLAEEKEAAEARKAEVLANLEQTLSKIADTRQTARGLIVSLPDILFDFDKATLRPDATTKLAKLAGVLILVPELDLSIEGHTDSTGTDSYNDWLSEARAETVAGFLKAEGIDEQRLETEGYGEQRPVAGNDSAEGRQQNRRVEVVIEGYQPLDRVADNR